jgi:hypothetical protein
MRFGVAKDIIARFEEGIYPKPDRVFLNEEGWRLARETAELRKSESEKSNLRHKSYMDQSVNPNSTICDGKTTNFYAVGGEIAAAISLGVTYTPTVNVFRAPGGDGCWWGDKSVQVKHTVRPDGNLFYRPDDPDEDDIYVLVRSYDPFLVTGWIDKAALLQLIRAGRSQATFDQGAPARLIGWHYLNPMSELRQEVLKHPLGWIE